MGQCRQQFSSCNEFEVDTAKFLLVALVSKVSNGLGSWTDFLSLQKQQTCVYPPQTLHSCIAAQSRPISARRMCIFRIEGRSRHSRSCSCHPRKRSRQRLWHMGRHSTNRKCLAGVPTSQPVSSIMVCAHTAQFINLKRPLQIALQISRNAAWIAPSNSIRCAMFILGKNFCISYISELDEDRNRLLQDWFFQCRCKRCLGA